MASPCALLGLYGALGSGIGALAKKSGRLQVCWPQLPAAPKRRASARCPEGRGRRKDARPCPQIHPRRESSLYHASQSSRADLGRQRMPRPARRQRSAAGGGAGSVGRRAPCFHRNPHPPLHLFERHPVAQKACTPARRASAGAAPAALAPQACADSGRTIRCASRPATRQAAVASPLPLPPRSPHTPGAAVACRPAAAMSAARQADQPRPVPDRQQPPAVQHAAGREAAAQAAQRASSDGELDLPVLDPVSGKCPAHLLSRLACCCCGHAAELAPACTYAHPRRHAAAGCPAVRVLICVVAPAGHVARFICLHYSFKPPATLPQTMKRSSALGRAPLASCVSAASILDAAGESRVPWVAAPAGAPAEAPAVLLVCTGRTCAPAVPRLPANLRCAAPLGCLQIWRGTSAAGSWWH